VAVLQVEGFSAGLNARGVNEFAFGAAIRFLDGGLFATAVRCSSFKPCRLHPKCAGAEPTAKRQRGDFLVAGLSLRGLGLARTNPRRLKRTPVSFNVPVT
jgi:hypothetical protein